MTCRLVRRGAPSPPSPPGRLRVPRRLLFPGALYSVAMPTRDQIMKALEAVIDPELRDSIVALDMVRSIDVHDDGQVDVMVSLTTPGCPIRSHFQQGVVNAVQPLEGVTRVNVAFDVLNEQQKKALQTKLGGGGLPSGALAQVQNVICVG